MIDTIVDLSHHNADFEIPTDTNPKVSGLIHKATQGTKFIDRKYQERLALCQESDILFGAYHFGNGEDGKLQAEHFLRTTLSPFKTLKILDVEVNPSGDTITLTEAEKFVTTVHQVTGVWPGLYSQDLLTQLIAGKSASPLFNCWLWCASYTESPRAPLPWKSWVLWQYTDGKKGDACSIPGIGFCDRSRFNGTLEVLRQFWTTHSTKLSA